MDGITARDKRFNYLTEDVGDTIALFCFCAVWNIAYNPKIKYTTFEDYASQQRGTTFDEGEMDIKVVLRDLMTDKERWIATWGRGGAEDPYTEEDYKRLDELFDTYADRQLKAGGMDTQAEYALKATCQDQLFAEKCRARGTKEDIQMYGQINKIIQDRLASEQMRRKDEKPVEELKIGGIIQALQDAGLVRRGKILPVEDLQEQLLRRLGALGGEPSHKYKYTIDAADQMLHMIQNTMFANSGLPETTEISDDMRFDENVVCEFSPEVTDTEASVYKNLGLIHERRPDGTKKGMAPEQGTGEE